MTSQSSITRREALACMGGAAAVSALGGIAFAADNASPGYVDIHTHLGTYRDDDGTPFTAEQLVRWMDATGVAKAIVLPLVSPESFRLPVSTENVLAMTSPHRDRLVPFCCIDPRNSWINSRSRIVKQLQIYKDQGARGFGEHKVAVPIDDPRNMDLFASCAEVGLPVLIHIDGIRNTDVPGLPGLEKILKSFPSIGFIGHALGIWSSISGGISQRDLNAYPRGKIESGGALDRLLDTYDNFYCDLSAGSGSNAIRRDPPFMRDFILRHPERILFGTDYLDPSMKPEQFELIADLKLPEDAFHKVASDNATALLKLT